MRHLVLGLDLGTTNLKAILVDRDGRVAGLASRRFECDLPAPGRAEIPPARFLGLARDAIAEALSRAGVKPGQVAALSWASQANTFLLLDERDEPLTPFIVWNDTRAAPLDDATLAFLSGDAFLRHAGFRLPVPELAIAKLRWIAREEPGLWKQARRFLSLPDYLAWTMTGEHVGDQATASLLGLWSQPEERWWPEALAFVGREASFFPRLLRPAARAGIVSAEGARALGLAEGTLVAAGTLDHHAAAWGAGIGALAPCSESTGTVIACLRLVDERAPDPAVFLGPDVQPGRWYAAAFSDRGASLLEHLRDDIAPGLEIAEFVARAAEAPPGSCVARIDGQRVAFEGDTSHPGARPRAVMLAIAHELEALVDRLHGDKRPAAIVATGGGAASDLWLSMKASVLGATVHRASSPSPAAHGAALLAATCVGWFPCVSDASAAWIRASATFQPREG